MKIQIDDDIKEASADQKSVIEQTRQDNSKINDEITTRRAKKIALLIKLGLTEEEANIL